MKNAIKRRKNDKILMTILLDTFIAYSIAAMAMGLFAWQFSVGTFSSSVCRR